MKKTEISIQKITNNDFLECIDMTALEAVYDVYLNCSKEFRISCTPENLEELIMGRLYTENRISGTEEMKEIIIREQEKEIHIKTEKEAGESQKKNQGKKKCYEGEAMTLFAAADKIFENTG